jgi:flagellar protein FlbD
MIVLTRFDGSRIVLNDSHIERIDITPDTVITLTNGDRYLVRESADDIINMISEFQAKIALSAARISALAEKVHDVADEMAAELTHSSSDSDSSIEDAEVIEDAGNGDASHGSEN